MRKAGEKAMEEYRILEAGEWLVVERDDCWLLKEGRVELYAAITENGQIKERHFLTEGHTGAFLLPLPQHQTVCVLAISLERTRLLRIDMKENPSDELRVAFLEAAVRFYLSACADERSLRCQKADCSGVYSLQAMERLKGSEAAVYWTKLPPKVSWSAGDEALVRQLGFVPLSQQVFFWAQEAAEIELKSSSVMLQSYGWAELERIRQTLADAFLQILLKRFADAMLAFSERAADKTAQRQLIRFSAWLELMRNILPDLSFFNTCRNTSKYPLVAALQLIGNFYDVSRINMQLSEEESKLQRDEVIRIFSQKTGLSSRPVDLNEKWFSCDMGPLLVFQGEHPFAILPAGASSYELFDPVSGERKRLKAGSDALFDTAAYVFLATLPSNVRSFGGLLQWAGRQCFKSDWVTVLWCCLFAGLIPVALPVITQTVFYDILPSFDRQAHTTVVQVLFVSAVANGLFSLTRTVALLRLKNKARLVMESALWLKLLSLPLAFFRRWQIGDLAMRMQAVTSVAQGFSGTVAAGLFGGIFSFWNILVMGYYNFKITLFVLGFWLLYLLLTVFLNWRFAAAKEKQTELAGQTAGQTLQLFNGLAKFRVAAAEERAFYLWTLKFSQELKWNLRSRWQKNYLEVLSAVQPLLLNLCIFFLIMYLMDGELRQKSAYLVQSNLLGFYSAMGAFGSSFSGMIPAITALLGLRPTVKRLKPILQAQSEDNSRKMVSRSLTGNILLANVCFRYGPERPLALDHVSLKIQPGQFVGIVGESGSGKSTLLKILLGLETAERGEVLFDEQDLNELDVRSVRRQIGVVMQNGRLLADSVYNNIVGSLPLSVDDAWEAAKMAGLEQDIQEMPMGMYTMISEGGRNISGGQRQRLLIARSLAGRPKIILFDEATSALDNRTQAIVAKTMQDMKATRIVVAHRLSTIRGADLIVVMAQGRVAEMGTFEELIQKKGLFAELARRQTL